MAVYGAITIPDNRSDLRLISYRNIPVCKREALSNVIGFIYLLMIHYSRGLSLVKIEDNILGHSRTRIPEQSRLWSVSTTLIYYFVTLYVKVKLICIRIWNGRNDISRDISNNFLEWKSIFKRKFPFSFNSNMRLYFTADIIYFIFIYNPSLKCYLGSSWLCTRPGPMVLRCSIKYKVAPGEPGHSTAHFEHRALNCCPQVWCYQNLKSISKEMGVWIGI